MTDQEKDHLREAEPMALHFPLTEEQLTFFDEQGYLVVPNAVSDNLCLQVGPLVQFVPVNLSAILNGGIGLAGGRGGLGKDGSTEWTDEGRPRALEGAATTQLCRSVAPAGPLRAAAAPQPVFYLRTAVQDPRPLRQHRQDQHEAHALCTYSSVALICFGPKDIDLSNQTGPNGHASVEQ